MTRPRQAELLTDYDFTSDGASQFLALAVYMAVIVLLVAALPSSIFNPQSTGYIFFAGLIATWRYLWGLTHLLRALIFQRLVYPRMRRRMQAGNWKPRHLYIAMMSYAVKPQTSNAVLSSLFFEVGRANVPATLVVSVANEAEKNHFELLATALQMPDKMTLILMVQDGTGKRAALGQALRAITRRQPHRDSVLCLLDGDTIVGEGLFDRTLGYFGLDERLGALTTDNQPLVSGSNWTKEWYFLRMAQRHVYMSSLSLSRRLLVLTGRCSMFRGELAFRPEFINRLVEDYFQHWQLGRVKMLSGDDKSTWLSVLSGGWNMLYCPDVVAYPVEELPPGHFLKSTTALMTRWFGNMLRANSTALALPRKTTGYFLWWCLVDQRISIWSSLSGPLVAMLGMVVLSPYFIAAYILWVALSRLFHAGVIFIMRGRFTVFHIPLHYFGQVVGAAIKVYISTRLHRQKWTRQDIRGTTRDVHSFWPSYVNVLAIFTFILVVGSMAGLIRLDLVL